MVHCGFYISKHLSMTFHYITKFFRFRRLVLIAMMKRERTTLQAVLIRLWSEATCLKFYGSSFIYKNKNITIKIIGIMKRLSMTLSRKSLLTIYKYFVRPFLDIIYDKSYNELFKGKLEAFQYNNVQLSPSQ